MFNGSIVGLIKPPKIAKMNAIQFDQLDQNLKSLHIHCDTEFDLALKILNDLKQRDEEITLALSNLRVLVLHVNDDYQTSYVLRTPKLQVLVCDWAGRMDGKHSKSIKRINCDLSFQIQLHVLVAHRSAFLQNLYPNK